MNAILYYFCYSGTDSSQSNQTAESESTTPPAKDEDYKSKLAVAPPIMPMPPEPPAGATVGDPKFTEWFLKFTEYNQQMVALVVQNRVDAVEHKITQICAPETQTETRAQQVQNIYHGGVTVACSLFIHCLFCFLCLFIFSMQNQLKWSIRPVMRKLAGNQQT